MSVYRAMGPDIGKSSIFEPVEHVISIFLEEKD